MAVKVPSKMVKLANQQQISGVVIDVQWMESSGGGPYPAFKFQNGKYIGLESENVGDLVYDLNDPEVEMDRNNYHFYSVDPDSDEYAIYSLWN